MGAVSLFRIALDQAPQWGKKVINGVKIVFYSHTFIFMLSSNKVWEKRLISGLSQAGTAWLRKSSRYDSRDFWAGLGGPSTSSRLR